MPEFIVNYGTDKHVVVGPFYDHEIAKAYAKNGDGVVQTLRAALPALLDKVVDAVDPPQRTYTFVRDHSQSADAGMPSGSGVLSFTASSEEEARACIGTIARFPDFWRLQCVA